MKLFCIIGFCNMYVLPYAKTYIKAIQDSGAECTLLFWDRDEVDGGNDNFPGCRKLCYQRKKTPESSAKDKVLGYLGASKYFRKVIKEENFDGLIFLQTHAAIACQSVLNKQYQGRYIVDIRDWTLENYGIYRNLEKKAIDSSFATVISSPAYSKFLPEHDYVVAHNYTPFPEDQVKAIREQLLRDKPEPIGISFVGTIRFIDMDKKILKLFANDERFSINYFGTGSDILETFCKEQGINNTQFYGSFSPDMTTSFYEKTDIINNLYGNHNKFLDYALSNKLYHAGQFHMPILVCPDTYMEEISKEYGMGFVFDVDDAKNPDKLYEWYSGLDRDKLAEGCDRFIEKVKQDNEKFYALIKDFVGS
ncbi:MAG: hypothetical protein M0T74_08730 [Desulfitobacterium hafniense]|nr:hypothetical protein [Desulfitobacterium hafniense]